MENKATTKTPISTRSGFHNFAICTLIFAFSISLPSTLVEPPLQISPFFRKTNPILIRTKPMQPSLPQGFMQINHPCRTRENKPNQTQFPRPRPNPRPSFLSRYRTSAPNPLYKIRFTRYEIRDSSAPPREVGSMTIFY